MVGPRLRVLVFRLVLTGFLSPCFVLAASDPGPRLAETTHRTLVAVHALLDEKRYVEAQDRLERLRERTRQRPYDQAVVLRTLGHVQHALGEEEEAISSLRGALALESLPVSSQREVRYNLAVLQIGQGRDREALQTLSPVLDKAAGPETLYLAAMAHYRLGECDAAIPRIERALSLSAEPPLDWRELQAACLLELGRFDEALPVLRDLAGRSPGEGRYWRQLAFAHQESGRKAEAAAVLALAHRRGVLDSEGIRILAGLYVSEGLPWRAATLVEASLSQGALAPEAGNWNLLADSLLAAGETEEAIPVMRRMAEAGQDAGPWLRLARVLFTGERWAESVEAFDRALDLGGVDDPGSAYLLLGAAAIRAGDPERARQAFDLALNDPAAGEKAGRWIEWLDHPAHNQGTQGPGN